MSERVRRRLDAATLASVVLAVPNSLRFNVHYFGWRRGLRLPVLVSHRVWIDRLRGRVELADAAAPTAAVRIGFGEVGIFDRRRSRSIWRVDGTVVFAGEARLGHGSRISVDRGALVRFGRGFRITAESAIVARKEIRFGDDVLISWDVQIMDTDFHRVYREDGSLLNPDREIVIGSRVWVGSRVLILKGAVVPDGTVVGAGSTVAGPIDEPNAVIAGVPARPIAHNVSWE